MQKCPHCGKPIEVKLIRAGRSGPLTPAGWNLMQSMESNAPTPWSNGRLEQSAPVAPTMGGGFSAYKRTPARAATVESDVIVPIAKGLALGLATAALSVVPTVLSQAWPWYSPLVVLVVVAPASIAGWLFWHQGLLMEISHVDQEPPAEPEPPPAAPAIEISATYRDDNDRPAARRFTLPHDVTDQTFYDFLTGVLSGGKSLSRTDWTGTGKPLSRSQHQQLINELARLRAVTLVDLAKPTMGYELTRLGRSLFQGWIESLGTRQNEWD